MSTVAEQVREKAKNIRMLQSLVKSQKAQNDDDALFDTIVELIGATNDIRSFSFENNSFEGLVVYVNVSSFVIQFYMEERWYEEALRYAAGVGADGLSLIYKIRQESPAQFDDDKAAHFKYSLLLQVVTAFLGCMNDKEYEEKFLGEVFKNTFNFVARQTIDAYSELRDISSNSPYVYKGGGIDAKLRQLLGSQYHPSNCGLLEIARELDALYNILKKDDK